VAAPICDVRFYFNSGHQSVSVACPLGANRRRRTTYPITSSAPVCSVCGMVRPSAFATGWLHKNIRRIDGARRQGDGTQGCARNQAPVIHRPNCVMLEFRLGSLVSWLVSVA
jgi:hypothetical protein